MHRENRRAKEEELGEAVFMHLIFSVLPLCLCASVVCLLDYFAAAAHFSFMKRSPCVYTSSALGNRSRHTLVAAASAGSARPNASMVSHPSYPTLRKARNVSSQCTMPVPGVPRSLSLI